MCGAGNPTVQPVGKGDMAKVACHLCRGVSSETPPGGGVSTSRSTTAM